jgi:hypothetical protein
VKCPHILKEFFESFIECSHALKDRPASFVECSHCFKEHSESFMECSHKLKEHSESVSEHDENEIEPDQSFKVPCESVFRVLVNPNGTLLRVPPRIPPLRAPRSMLSVVGESSSMRKLILIALLMSPATAFGDEDTVDKTLDKARQEVDREKEAIQKSAKKVDEATRKAIAEMQKEAREETKRLENASKETEEAAQRLGRASRDEVNETVKGTESGVRKGRAKAHQDLEPAKRRDTASAAPAPKDESK